MYKRQEWKCDTLGRWYRVDASGTRIRADSGRPSNISAEDWSRLSKDIKATLRVTPAVPVQDIDGQFDEVSKLTDLALEQHDCAASVWENSSSAVALAVESKSYAVSGANQASAMGTRGGASDFSVFSPEARIGKGDKNVVFLPKPELAKENKMLFFFSRNQNW